MIGVVAAAPLAEAKSLVGAALHRSLGLGAVAETDFDALPDSRFRILVAIGPSESEAKSLARWLTAGPRKVVLFGELPQAIVRFFGQTISTGRALPARWAEADPAGPRQFSESPGAILYCDLVRHLGGAPWRRALSRFDFADEWNNLPYGAVRTDNSIWALAASQRLTPEAELAVLSGPRGEALATYASLLDQPDAALLWFNRPTGPIDSVEWRLVENFLSAHRADDLPSAPVLSEIPFGHDAAATMRLDCDEDLASARPLFDAYGELGVPFSLAVHTALLADKAHHPLLRDARASGGSLLSHSATHPADWGGSHAAALAEAKQSAAAIAAVTGTPPRFAVSPFHRTTGFALAALAEAGYDGCIGGSASGDPQFVMARGGAAASLPPGFAFHTQQCMLHGDCLAPRPDPIATFRAAFDLALAGGSFFAWLDHPFSLRYQYGWPDEETRIQMHRLLIAHIRARAKNPLFLSQDAAMDFLRLKSLTRLGAGLDGAITVTSPENPPSVLPLAIDYRGKRVPAGAGV